MFQVSEIENYENGKWLESSNAFSQGKWNTKYMTVNQGSWTYSTKYKLQVTIVSYSFNNSLSLKFFQRIKLTKQFNQCNKQFKINDIWSRLLSIGTGHQNGLASGCSSSASARRFDLTSSDPQVSGFRLAVSTRSFPPPREVRRSHQVLGVRRAALAVLPVPQSEP